MWHVKYKTDLCWNFMKTGVCFMEDRCTFAHGYQELRKIEDNFPGEEFAKQRKPKCKYWSTGQCRFGDKCIFSHDADNEEDQDLAFQDCQEEITLFIPDSPPPVYPPPPPMFAAVHGPPPVFTLEEVPQPHEQQQSQQQVGSSIMPNFIEFPRTQDANVSSFVDDRKNQDDITEMQLQAMLEGIQQFILPANSVLHSEAAAKLKAVYKLLAEKKFGECVCAINQLILEHCSSTVEVKQVMKEVMLNSVTIGVSMATHLSQRQAMQSQTVQQPQVMAPQSPLQHSFPLFKN